MPRILVHDLETTGLAPPAEVIEFGWCELVNEDGAGWQIGDRGYELFYAETNPPETRAVNHIDPMDLRGHDPFDISWLHSLAPWRNAQVIAAHVAKFEEQWTGEGLLAGQYPLCTWKAALRLWPDAPGHGNQLLRYWLEDQGLISVDTMLADPPHRAAPDAYITAIVLQAMLSLTSAKQMVAWSREPALLPRCPLGKFRGKPWAEVETGFLSWITRTPDLDPDVQWNASRELSNRGM